MRNPLLPSPSGISRWVSSIQPKSAIRCERTRSRSRSSAVTGRGGTRRATWGVNVLGDKEIYKERKRGAGKERYTIHIIDS